MLTVKKLTVAYPGTAEYEYEHEHGHGHDGIVSTGGSRYDENSEAAAPYPDWQRIEAGSAVQRSESGRRAALEEISFDLHAGERVALIGANGAGKTTLLRSLLGLLPFKGEILLKGVPLSKKSLTDFRKKIGIVFQNPDDQLFMPTVGADVTFAPRSYGVSQAEAADRADQILKQLRISGLAERSPLHLSGGEKRLAAIAGVLAHQPDLLLLDEPAAFLDSMARRRLIETLSSLPQGMLIATHDLRLAERLCSRMLLISAGRKMADGAIALLREKALMYAAGVVPLGEDE